MNLIYYFTILILFGYSAIAQFCTNFPPSADPGPVQNIPTKFQARVEVNMIEENRMMEMRIFYDYDNRKAAIELKENNSVNKLIFNYDLDEIYQIKYDVSPPTDILYPPDERPQFPSTCNTFKLSETSSLNYYFGFQPSAQNMILPGPVYQIFRFYPQAYIGPDTTRGIPTDSYVSCQYNPDTKQNFTVKHYFSQTGYSMAGANRVFNKLLLRASYNGVVQQSDGSLKQFTTIHDYHDFRLNIERPSVFQTPSGLFCNNRKVSKKIPDIKSSFSFSQEIITNSMIQYVKNFHLLDNLTRFEIRNTKKEPITYYTLDPIVFITDLSIGVQYAINQVHFNCSLSGVSRENLRQKFNQTFSSNLDYITTIQATQSFLQLDSDYIFNGVRESNGIQSDRFISNRLSNIYEYTFSNDEFSILSEHEIEKSVPISLYIDSPKNDLSSHSNFFNFDKFIASPQLFDIGLCYTSNDIIEFDIIFPYKGKVDGSDIMKVEKLDIVFLAILYELTGVDGIRFKNPKLSVSADGNFYVHSAIYPPPPPLSLFNFVDNKLLLVSAINTYYNLSTPDDCARVCIFNERCQSFDFSSISKVCHLNNKTITDGASATGSSYYSHYTKNVPGSKKFLDKVEILNLLTNQVADKKVIFDVPVKDNNGELKIVILEAKDIKETRYNNRFGTTALLSRYNLVRPKSKYSTSQEIESSGFTIDDCVQACSNNLGFECKSFDFCYLTGDCRLRRYLLSENETDILSDNNCDIYERDPLIHYDRFRTKVSVNPKDLKYTEVKTASECASKCDNELKINCKSFNFCPNSNLCYLSKSHSTDSSASLDENSLCDHYSRKYLQDFTFIGTSDIKLDAQIVETGGSLEACGASCVTTGAFNCKTFDYCPVTKTCLLNSGQAQLVLNENVATDRCGHYRSVLIGLSITFSISSVLAGLFGTIFFFKKKNLS